MTIVSIDPGKNGAVSVLNLEKKEISIFRMPKNFKDLMFLFELYTGQSTIFIVEKVQLMPSDSEMGKIFRMQKLTKNLNQIENAIEAVGGTFIHVFPRAWQSFLNLKSKSITTSKDRKNLYKKAANEYLKQYTVTGVNKSVALWNSDAICIGEYLRRNLILNPNFYHESLQKLK
jgi:hypothetical protein